MPIVREDSVPPRAQRRGNHRVPLKQLWSVLPKSVRQDTLRTLGRILAQHLEESPGRKEVPHERP